MKKFIHAMLLLPAIAGAGHLEVEDPGDGFVGPATDEVVLLAVRETSPYGSTHPLAARIRNNSAQHLDRVAIKCTVTDAKGYRVFKGLVFKTNPIFSVRIDFPPISTPEIGIPPGMTTEVGLYTSDNRWMRGNGDYQYDCDMYGVSGRD